MEKLLSLLWSLASTFADTLLKTIAKKLAAALVDWSLHHYRKERSQPGPIRPTRPAGRPARRGRGPRRGRAGRAACRRSPRPSVQSSPTLRTSTRSSC
jgi:hypothetical protein